VSSCGSVAGGPSLEGVDISKRAIVQGVVVRGDQPVNRAYVRLLDSNGEFTAEVPTSMEGHFRFFASPGKWSVRALANGGSADATIDVVLGTPAEVRLAL